MNDELGCPVNDWVTYEHGTWRRSGCHIEIRSNGPACILPAGFQVKPDTQKTLVCYGKSHTTAEVIGWETTEAVVEASAYDKLEAELKDLQNRHSILGEVLTMTSANEDKLEAELTALKKQIDDAFWVYSSGPDKFLWSRSQFVGDTHRAKLIGVEKLDDKDKP